MYGGIGMNKSMDALTGLISGVELDSEMEALITNEKEFSFVMLDIDTLLDINRDYGYEAGDEVFRVISKYLQLVFPPPCMLFRDVRDQFDVLLPGFSKEEAFLKSETVRKLIFEEKLDFKTSNGKPLTQTVSVGVSAFPDDGNRVAEIIRKADGAMIRAKKNGRNQVCLAREEKMITKTSHYTQFQLEKLSETAKKLEIGEAVLLREALDDLLRKYDK